MTAYLARNILQLMRPHQWIKNIFILTGLVFGHAWSDSALVQAVLLAIVAFSLLSSAIYIINDLADIESDRAHPRKRLRPIAAGNIQPLTAGIVAAVLMLLALGLGFMVSPEALALLLIYLVMNIGYSLGLKHVAILDVFLIAAGFMLRILVGTLGVGIAPSQWLLLCGMMVTLFLGFAKRRAELAVAAEQGSRTRKVLLHYDEALVDVLMAITGTATIITYALYTVNPATVQIHGTEHLVYTVPFVVYGMARYVFRLHRHRKGEDPARELVTDPHLIATVLAWAAAVFWLIR
jgi:4-hydroxybenzoate polyprenyltransferase